MKKIMYSLILLLVVVSGLVSANRDIKNEESKKPDLKTKMAGPAKIVFKSTDGGQTWQDISKGLPENLRVDSIRGNSFFANDKGLFLRVGNGLYHNTPNATSPFWTKETIPDEHSSIAPGKSGIAATNYWGVNLKTTNGTNVWSPIFENFQERLRSVFETSGGTIFIAIDRGIIRSTDSGKTWKHVYAGRLVGNLAESNGVLLATSRRKIIRSIDNGDNWAPVISEDSVAFDVKSIKGGFVAITSNSESNTPNTSRLSTSYDGGKTWQSIHSALRDKVVINSIGRNWNDRINDRLRAHAFMTSITQVGENFFSAHPSGIFRSSDKGKTWKLLLPSVEDKGFNLFVSGNVIYAIPSKGGC
ncbi:WD40/YVTN/BNR-like repeat-containing protein [Adhaeribacter arboris]|nr:exo-alpha-sialidase [Adhaeribacter arboris]